MNNQATESTGKTRNCRLVTDKVHSLDIKNRNRNCWLDKKNTNPSRNRSKIRSKIRRIRRIRRVRRIRRIRRVRRGGGK